MMLLGKRWLRSFKFLGWILVILEIVFVFLSSRAIPEPTTLWDFFVSVVALISGYKLFTIGRI
jgi:hypothetical protein